jgi:hypothetical protein
LDEAGDGGQLAAGAVGEEFFEDVTLLDRKIGDAGGEFDHVNEAGGEGADGEAGGGEIGAEFFQAERREGGGAAESQHGRENRRCFVPDAARSRGGDGSPHFRTHTGNFAEKAVDRRGPTFGMAHF